MDSAKINFSSFYDSNIMCDLCNDNIPQTTDHLLFCRKLLDNCKTLFNDIEVEYQHIFSGNQQQQLKAVKLFNVIFKVKQETEDAITSDD